MKQFGAISLEDYARAIGKLDSEALHVVRSWLRRRSLRRVLVHDCASLPMIPRNILFERAWELLSADAQAVLLDQAVAYFDSVCEEHTHWKTNTGWVLLREPVRYKTITKGSIVLLDHLEHVVLSVDMETAVTGDVHRLPLRRTVIFNVTPVVK